MNLRKAGAAGFPLRDDIVVGARKGDAEVDSEAILLSQREERLHKLHAAHTSTISIENKYIK